MMATPEALFVGSPGNSSNIEGSKEINCEFCGTPAWFGPSTFVHPMAANGHFVCIKCAREKTGGKPLDVADITPEQRADLKKAGMEDEMIDSVVAAIRSQGIPASAIEFMGAFRVPPEEASKPQAIPGDKTRLARPTDDELVALHTIYKALARLGDKDGAPEMTPSMMATLLEEIVERRAIASGLLAQLLREKDPAFSSGSICSRPPDNVLASLAKYWRQCAETEGPQHMLEIEAMALVTLSEELIELRKAPRA